MTLLQAPHVATLLQSVDTATSDPGLTAGVLFVPALLGAIWIYRDAKARGNDHPANWAISTFLWGVLAFFPMIVGLGLWVQVRGEKD